MAFKGYEFVTFKIGLIHSPQIPINSSVLGCTFFNSGLTYDVKRITYNLSTLKAMPVALI